MPLLPALLLACFAFWSGTFPGAAAFPAGPAGQGLVLAAAIIGAAAWRDPLRLGGAGRWLVGALLAAVALSLWVSPVARAGRVGVVLLPAYLLLAPFVARCWSSERRREIGLTAWSVVVAATALWAIVEQVRHHSSRAAMPLGHHNLLAAFLVISLPLAVPALRRRETAGEASLVAIPGLRRTVALVAIVAGVVALVLTRSFLGAAALAVLALAGAVRFARARHLVVGLALLALALLVPRAAAIVGGEDSSASARQVYLRAGWQGATARPVFGWGPGSTPWTLAEHLRALPGINPQGEVVGEMHSLPLALAYELGFVGLALVVAVFGLFFLRRWRGRGAAADRGLVEAGLAGVAGFLLTALGGAQLSVTALPLAAALAAGAVLAGEGAPDERPGLRAVPVWIFAGAALFALLPLARAQAFYDQAAKLRVREQAAPLVARAMALDPEFALYRTRWAWSSKAPVGERAATAISAARAARGVAALWLRAGALALEAGRTDLAREASGRALALDPLSGFAPFQLAMLDGESAEGVDCAARALLAEPRLAAASFWRGREGQRQLALERLEHWPGVDAGWRSEMLKQAASAVPAPAEAGASAADEVELAAQIDTTPALAVSLHLFRRSPWPADVARIRVERAGVRKMQLPSAAALESSSADAFPRERCAPG